jgi:hypothetical protein
LPYALTLFSYLLSIFASFFRPCLDFKSLICAGSLGRFFCRLGLTIGGVSMLIEFASRIFLYVSNDE